jgi:uncharacterized protein involved in exopolysaccharide biosynthesis
MDQEIDLRPYFLALVLRWRLIVICAISLAVIGGAASFASTTRSATSDVVIIPSSSQVTLDARFQTTGSLATNPAAQRLGLINLASSRTLAEQVVKDLGDTTLSADALYAQVKVVSTSDLLQITVSNSDPDLALRIAQAWGKAYETLVISVYGGSQFRTDLLTTEINLAQQRYDQAQTALEKFLVSSQSIKIQQQIANLNDLLSGSRTSQQQLYADYLSRSHSVELILQDAQTLRDQVDTQGTSKFANSFASLMLRVRMVDSSAPVFRLTAADLASIETDPSNLSANLDQLIKALAHRRDQLLAQSNEVANAITSGGMIATGLDAATRQRYIDQVAELNSTYEQLQSQQTTLTQQRDLARDALTLLQRKRAEMEVAQGSPQVEVRFIGASIAPFSRMSRAILYAGVAGVLGLLVGTVLALFLDVVIPAVRQMSMPKSSQPANRPDAPPGN